MQQATNMLTRSTDESSITSSFRRKDRVYKKEGQWFFRCRETSDKGPFIDKQSAYWALARFMRQHA
jgi:hypothetical protein